MAGLPAAAPHTPRQRPAGPADALAGFTADSRRADLSGVEGAGGTVVGPPGRQESALGPEDAADSEQVRPLLSRAAGSPVLVTMRIARTISATAPSLESSPGGWQPR